VMRYEDFAHNPHTEMQRALTALGLDLPGIDNLYEADLVLRPTHSVGGNPLRFTTREALVKPDVEWQEKMPRAIKTILWLLAMPMMRRYEYSLG